MGYSVWLTRPIRMQDHVTWWDKSKRCKYIFMAFFEDNTTMSSIRYFENHIRYFVQNWRKKTQLTSISVWQISVSIALKYIVTSRILKETGLRHRPQEYFFFNPFPNKPLFLRVCCTIHLKTLWEKETLLVMSNVSFSHSVFYPLEQLSAVFIIPRRKGGGAYGNSLCLSFRPSVPYFCPEHISKSIWDFKLHKWIDLIKEVCSVQEPLFYL